MTEWAQFRIDASKHVARKSGQSSVAAAAYRAGEKLTDERTGEVHDFTKRYGVIHSELVMPESGGPDWSRQQLWNAAEAAEKRKDGRTARKVEMALPADMDDAKRLLVARSWARELADRYGVAVDFAIHRPDREGDQRNHHVHYMMTTRKIDRDGLGEKAHLELSNADQKKRGLSVGDDAIRELRQAMADRFNRECAAMGIALSVDPRSYAARGIDLEPTKHVGVHAVAMDRQGLQAERVAEHEQVRQANAQRIRESPEIVLERLGQQRGGFTATDMAKELNRYIDDAQEFQGLMARLQQSPEIVQVAPAQSGGDSAGREARYALHDKEQRAERAEQRARERAELRERWQAYREDFYSSRRRQRPAERLAEKARYRAVTETAHKARANVRTADLSSAERKARLSVIAAQAVQQREELRQQLAAQRPPAPRWQEWVRDRAEEGDAAAIRTVRGWAYNERRRANAMERAGKDAAGILQSPRPRMGTIEPMPPRKAVASAALDLAWTVDRRTGDVAYRLGEQQAFVDRGRMLTFDRDRFRQAGPAEMAAMEAGLKLAAQKFGPALDVQGTEAFRQLAVQVAVRQGMNIQFKDAGMQAQAEALRQQLAAEREQARARPEATPRPTAAPVRDPARPSGPERPARPPEAGELVTAYRKARDGDAAARRAAAEASPLLRRALVAEEGARNAALPPEQRRQVIETIRARAEADLDRLDRMPARELREEIDRLRPPAPREAARQDAGVIEAQAKHQAAQAAAEAAHRDRETADREAAAWRKEHPMQARMHDNGMRSAPYLAERERLAGELAQVRATREAQAAELAKQARATEDTATDRIREQQAPARAVVQELRDLAERREQQEAVRALAAQVASKDVDALRLMARARATGTAGWGDGGQQWKQLPADTRQKIEQLNALPEGSRAAVLADMERQRRERYEQNPAALPRERDQDHQHGR